MTRHTCLIIAVDPQPLDQDALVLTLEFADGVRAEYRAPGAARWFGSDELLAHVVELEYYPNPRTNWARVRTLTGDWFDVSQNYGRAAR